MSDLTGKWILDPTHSEASFVARHAMVTKVRGRFDKLEASVEHDGTVGHVSAVIDANTFNTSNSDRDAHVKGPDFLDVENFPTLHFYGELKDDRLAGELTIHGVTRNVVFEAEVSETVKDR